jgi:hypothetical protein
VLAELMGGAFTKSTTIVVLAGVMYIYDVSYFELTNTEKSEDDKIEDGALLHG